MTMGAFLLSLMTTLLALALVGQRRGSGVHVPVDGGRRERRPPRQGRRLAAVVPADDSPEVQGVVCRLLDHVDRVVVVHEPGAARRLADLRGHPSIDVVQVPDGRGAAMARARCAGVRHAIASHAPRAVLVVEPDAAAAVELVPDFISELPGHDAVVGACTSPGGRGSRGGRLGARLTGRLLGAILRGPVPDAGCAVRLFSIEALQRVPLDTQGWTSDVRHLKMMLAYGLDVVWLPVPAGRRRGHAGALVRRAVAVPAAIVAPVGLRAPGPAFWRRWSLRLAAAAAAVGVAALLVPLLQPVDRAIFTLLNGRIGDGPDWLHAVLDPHGRTHVLLVLLAAAAAGLSSRARVAGMVVALAAAGATAYALLEVISSVYVRPPPEEVLAPSDIRVSQRSGAAHASLPGNATVAIALAGAAAMAVRALGIPLLLYAAVIGCSRIAVGAYFPLDILASAVLGVSCAAFGVALAEAAGVLRPLSPAWESGRSPPAAAAETRHSNDTGRGSAPRPGTS